MKKIEEVHFLIPETQSNPKDNFFTFYRVINQFHTFDKKIYLGNDFICRYCGENGRKFFKKDNSHTFPECTGNKWMYSKDECTKCNQLFSTYENELASHGHIMRTFLGMKTKKGAPTKYKSRAFQIQRKEEGCFMNLFDKGEFPINPTKHGGVTFNMDFVKKEGGATINIPQMKFIPFYVLKCLSKIALAIMPDSEFKDNDFEELKKWLLTADDFITEQASPINYIYYATLPFADRKPLLQLYKKDEKYKDTPIPMYSLFFAYGNDMFQIFLSNCKWDKWIESSVSMPIVPFLIGITEDNKRGLQLIDGNVFEKVTSDGYKQFVF